MVKELRNKFVIVTTSLMVVVFGCFLMLNTIYNNYWNNIEIVDMLEWIADSGIFTLNSSSSADKVLVENITEDERPIIGIILDKECHIISCQMIGGGNTIQIPDGKLHEMYEKRESTNKIGKYYFAYSMLPNEEILLVIMDSSVNERLVLKVLIGFGGTLLGFLLLVLITLWLSRFVTKPAEDSILREKQFISDASHELKTPLGAISINAQALKLSGEDNLHINNILSESERMTRLIERLLTLSRLDETPCAEWEDVDISELCEEMSLTYDSVAYERKIDFVYEIDEQIYMRGDADELRQLIAILLDNAIKNTPENGQILLCLSKENGNKHIEIANTGTGISPEDLPHVFERFYTSDKSRQQSSFGLGLAIAKAIVERHKGKIEVESTLNQLTKFMITF